jgi:hypothetical protein
VPCLDFLTVALELSHVQVLKEEIRRQERNTTRADTSNLEYLKNVVLKYIEKQQEQEQLVPVLSMLLHFSPDELHRAQVAIQQQQQHAQLALAQQPDAVANALSSLTSYLPKWM